jgi:Pyruvate/2-oxoacid:ferredoxin oxidoreductase delta subunit
MYDCYATGGPYSPTHGHPDEIDFQEAGDFGREVVERSRLISAGETGLVPEYPEWVEFHVKKYIRERQAREKEMGVPEMTAERRGSMVQYDKEKCLFPKCRICMMNCPMDNIDISVDPPEIGNQCMMCRACIENCPTGAMSMALLGPPPEIPYEVSRAVTDEFYLKPLEIAEAQGRFRRLVPVDERYYFGRQPDSENEEKT